MRSRGAEAVRRNYYHCDEDGGGVYLVRSRPHTRLRPVRAIGEEDLAHMPDVERVAIYRHLLRWRWRWTGARYEEPRR